MRTVVKVVLLDKENRILLNFRDKNHPDNLV